MKKVVINPSWTCQLKCPYCWLPHTKINRYAREHDWTEWAVAIARHIPAGSIIDVSGGDPLLYPGLTALLTSISVCGINWAITTNALYSKGVDALIAGKPTRCVIINVSDHSGNEAAHENIEKLKAHFPVTVHRTDHPGAGHHEQNAGPITYQKWAEGEALDGVKRMCNSGVDHVVIDPGGDVFRCCVDMQVANKPMGNIFREDFHFMDVEKACDFGCSTCYTEKPNEWAVWMRAL
jgi:MoaA/NifB/PqqE/SkfB family radical SAM enzyme